MRGAVSNDRRQPPQIVAELRQRAFAPVGGEPGFGIERTKRGVEARMGAGGDLAGQPRFGQHGICSDHGGDARCANLRLTRLGIGA